MSEFKVINDDTIELLINSPRIVGELDSSSLGATIAGTTLIVGDVVLDRVSGSSEIISEALSAKTLVMERIASEPISALAPVYLVTPTDCALASNLAESTGYVVGIALNAGGIGATIKILVLGLIEDPFFNYGINEMLFLGAAGNITSVAPSSGVLTRIGFGLGAGAIQVSIEKPQLL